MLECYVACRMFACTAVSRNTALPGHVTDVYAASITTNLQWETVSRELAAATGSGVRPPLVCLQRHHQLVTAAAKEARQFGTQEGVAQLAVLVAKHGSSWKVQ